MSLSTACAYLEKLMELQSFSAASKVLGITQPSLSSYIKKLENQYQLHILQRKTQPLLFTHEGKELLAYLQQALLLEKSFTKHISDMGNLQHGELTLGGSSSFNQCFLPKAIRLFHSRYPNITIHVIEGTTSALAEKSVSGELDVFITAQNKGGSYLQYDKLFDESVLLCVPEPWAINEQYVEYRIPLQAVRKLHQNQDRFSAVPLDILRDLPFISMPPELFIGALCQTLFQHANCACNSIATVDQMATAYAMVTEGAGAALITESSLYFGNYLHYPNLYLIPREFYSRSIFAATAIKQSRSKLCSAFLQALQESLHDYIS